jgi:hypothetical protein
MSLPSRRTAAWIGLAVLATLLTVLFAQRPGDFAGYVLVGELALTGRDIYREAPPNISTWPPVFSLICMAIAAAARVSLVGARVVWLLLNWAALYACAWIVARAVRPEATTGPRVDITSAVVALPLLLCARWIVSNFEHLQVNILIFALVLAGLLLHRARREAAGGTLLGLAAALKVMPVVFIPYFLVRRQWRVAGFMTVAVIGWSLLPAAVYGWTTFVAQHDGWREAIHAGWSVGKMNISVFAALDRHVGHGIVPFAAQGFNDLAASGAVIVDTLLVAALVLLAALAVWLFRGPYDPTSRATVAEWSIVLLVASLFGTVAWKAYLVVLLLPMALFVATWRDTALPERFRARLRLLAWLSFALGWAAESDLVGRRLAWRLEMGSLPTLTALLVLGTLLWYRGRQRAAMPTRLPVDATDLLP